MSGITNDKTKQSSDQDIHLGEQSKMVIVANPQGLHARPVMKFVDIARQFQAQVKVCKNKQCVDGKNPMEMMLLEATQGTELELLADGPDADQALDRLAQLIQDGFGEQ